MSLVIVEHVQRDEICPSLLRFLRTLEENACSEEDQDEGILTTDTPTTLPSLPSLPPISLPLSLPPSSPLPLPPSSLPSCFYIPKSAFSICHILTGGHCIKDCVGFFASYRHGCGLPAAALVCVAQLHCGDSQGSSHPVCTHCHEGSTGQRVRELSSVTQCNAD